MQVEILIHADVKILEDDDIDALREEIIERKEKSDSMKLGADARTPQH